MGADSLRLSEDGAAGVDWNTALAVFEGLSRPGRLAVFRRIVRAGEAGIAGQDLMRELRTTGSALTLHLRALSDVGLVRTHVSSRPGGGRSARFVADVDLLVALIQLLHAERPQVRDREEDDRIGVDLPI